MYIINIKCKYKYKMCYIFLMFFNLLKIFNNMSHIEKYYLMGFHKLRRHDDPKLFWV